MPTEAGSGDMVNFKLIHAGIHVGREGRVRRGDGVVALAHVGATLLHELGFRSANVTV
jgi:hypothetical protein